MQRYREQCCSPKDNFFYNMVVNITIMFTFACGCAPFRPSAGLPTHVRPMWFAATQLNNPQVRTAQ